MMNELFFRILSATEGSESTPSGNSGGGSATEILKKVFTSPIFYAVIGGIILLIIVFYLVRRNIKAKPNKSVIVVRKGKIHCVVDNNNPKYFLVPFTDKVGATISLDEIEFSSDKLFVNNGPDALYKINFTIKYKVIDPVSFYPYNSNINDLMINKINEDLREFADKGNALILIKDYREHNQEIIDLINNALKPYSVVVTSYKVNLIEPLGRK